MEVTIKLDITHCCQCGITFGVPVEFVRNAIRDKFPIHCPNGHENFYELPPAPETEADRERRRVEMMRIHLEDQAAAAKEARKPRKSITQK